jgi:hypothetical protein
VKLINGTSNLYRLGDTFAGEWVEYTVNIGQAGNYKLDFRLSQTDPNAKLHAELDGKSIASLTVPDTNNFSVFSTVSRTVALPAGRHVFRLAFDQAARSRTVAGVDWIKFSPAAATASAFSSSNVLIARTVASAFDAVQSELELSSAA